MLFDTLSGNDFALKVGPMTFVEIVFAALRTRSGSTRIFGRLGAIEAKMPTTSSDFDIDLSSLSEELSANAIGLVVNIAVRRRRNKSYHCQLGTFLGRSDSLTPSSLLILRCSPKLVLSTFSPSMAANSNKLGRVCRWGNGLANKSFKKVMQSVQISSIASSSKERAYSTKNTTKSVSLSVDVKVDLRDGSKAEGFVRL